MPIIKTPITVRHDITPKDMVDIKDAARDIQEPLKRFRAIAMVDFLESTGCRVDELAKLRVTDMNLSDGKVLIRGKGNKERYVYLNSTCCKHIIDYLNYKKLVRKESIFVFSNFKSGILDKPMNPHMLENVTIELGKACGIEKLTIHIFRRYFATTCHKRGVSAETLRLLMGHSNYSTTLRYIAEDIDTTLLEYRSVC